MSEETETEVPETLTFAQGRDMLADDLERVGGFFTEAAKECREGDIDAMARVVSQMSVWRDMLLLRFEDRMNRMNARHEKKPKRDKSEAALS